MVKLYFVAILYKQPTKAVHLKSASDLSSFNFFQKNSVHEFMRFTSQILVERTIIATRSSIKEQEYMCHVFVRGDSLAGIVISDHEYPHRVAHNFLNKILEEFAAQVPSSRWLSANDSTGAIPFPNLDNYLKQYQNPKEADPITRIQSDLDETKIILHNTMEAVLERGEKIDDLVAKSDQLSVQSKAFYTTARKTNQCSCTIL